MNFSEQQNAQSSLPQFSELTGRNNSQPTNATTTNYASTGVDLLQAAQNTIYTTAADSHTAKQILVSQKYLFINLMQILIFVFIYLKLIVYAHRF